MIHCPTSEFYGHAEIFRQYAGINKKIPINGRLQHGWTPKKLGGVIAGDSLDKQGIKFFTWTEMAYGYNHESTKVPIEQNRVFPVGAPILYLNTPRIPQNRFGVLAIPSHSIATTKIQIGVWEEWCKYILYYYGAKTDVLIHWRDVENGYDKLARDFGLGVKTCGRITEYDFLKRNVAILQSYNYIVSNCVQTSCFYADYLGTKVIFDGPPTPKDPPAGYDDVVFEKEYVGNFKINCAEELGLKFKRSPDELKNLMFNYA